MEGGGVGGDIWPRRRYRFADWTKRQPSIRTTTFAFLSSGVAGRVSLFNHPPPPPHLIFFLFFLFGRSISPLKAAGNPPSPSVHPLPPLSPPPSSDHHSRRHRATDVPLFLLFFSFFLFQWQPSRNRVCL